MTRNAQINLASYIREIPDFPQPGVLFRDITPLLLDPDAYRYAVDELARRIEPHAPDAIVGIESRGFLVGAPVAYTLGLPFVPVRKAGKLPAERMSVEFALEYGEGQLDIHADALQAGQRVVIVDDLLATGGTAAAAKELVERLGASVAAAAFVVELAELDGRRRLASCEVTSIICFGESA